MAESDKPKIMFADEPGRGVATIHGLPLTVSPAASDILAAVHLGFSEAMAFWSKMTQPPPGGGGLTMMPGEPGEYLEEDLPPSGLGPLALAAWREAKGIKVEFPEPENPEDHPAYQEMDENMQLQGLGDEGPGVKK